MLICSVQITRSHKNVIAEAEIRLEQSKSIHYLLLIWGRVVVAAKQCVPSVLLIVQLKKVHFLCVKKINQNLCITSPIGVNKISGGSGKGNVDTQIQEITPQCGIIFLALVIK